MSDMHTEIQAAWADAGQRIEDQQTKALFGGVNIRVNLQKAFKAVYTSAKLYFDVHAAPVAGAMGPGFLLTVGKDVYDVILATLDSLVERMPALEYTACVVLSRYEADSTVTVSEFERAVRELLELGEGKEIPWYFGLTRKHLRESREQLEGMGDFSKLMDRLREKEWLTETGGKIAFRPRHYTWGSKLD